MFKFTLLLNTVFLFMACTSLSWEAYPEQLKELTASQWQDDLLYLQKELPRRHPNLFHTVTAQAFHNTVEDLLKDSELIEDSEVLASFMISGISRLLASIGEGHTSLNMYSQMRYPVILQWFPNAEAVDLSDAANWELRVVQTLEDHSALLGGIVTHIGSMPLAEAELLMNSAISVDIAKHRAYRVLHMNRFMDPYFMQGLGFADDERRLSITVKKPAGDAAMNELTDSFMPQPFGEDTAWMTARKHPEQYAQPLPLELRDLPLQQNQNYWYSAIDEDQLYVQYNVCRSEAKAFFAEVLDELQANGYTKLIVDLRANSGGNSRPGTWFAKRLAKLPEFQREGSIVTLIGPATFSSGMWLAVDMMHYCGSVFAGEATQAPPNGYGEVKRFRLPESQLIIGHSSRLWRYARGKNLSLDEKGRIVPDPSLQHASTFAQWTSGHDAAFRAVVSYENNYE